jgi:hypothetical protein
MFLITYILLCYAATMKNKLEGYTLRASGTFPTYLLRTNGEPHNMTFEYTVQVDGQTFVSATRHAHRKDAEEDAANVAYTSLMGTETIEGLCNLIKQVMSLLLLPILSCLENFLALKVNYVWR